MLRGEISFESIILAKHPTTAQQNSAGREKKQFVGIGYSIHSIRKVISGKGFYNGLSCISLRVQMYFLVEVQLFYVG